MKRSLLRRYPLDETNVGARSPPAARGTLRIILPYIQKLPKVAEASAVQPLRVAASATIFCAAAYCSTRRSLLERRLCDTAVGPARRPPLVVVAAGAADAVEAAAVAELLE